MLWRLTAIGTAHEQYSVEAETEKEARAKFAAGNFLACVVSETDDTEIVAVEPWE